MLAGEASASGDVAATAATATAAGREAQNEGGEAAAAAAGIIGSSNSGEDDKSRVLDEAERGGGNRWPRQETMALLKIRSDMDVAFRDASVKAPLWDEVSRKLGELGYNRSAKKCKEKFENVFKYHKRTKDGRTSKGPQGKTYRFFDQLEAFQHQHFSLHHPPSPPPKPQAPVAVAAAATPTAVSLAMAPAANNPPITSVPSTTHIITSTTIPTFPSTNINPTNYPSQSNIPSAVHNISTDDLVSNSTSSSTSSDLELEVRRKRKRKWRDFFERLMKEVVDKQEELQNKFLQAIEKREHERMVREESWRTQEMSRINREREILAQERSNAAAKDAAVMSFLQKLADQQQNPGTGQVIISNDIPPSVLPQATVPTPTPAPALALVQSQPPPPPPPQQQVFSMETMKRDNGERNNYMGGSSSRWPKVEIEALINLRTNLDSKYQENGPKGPLWEEISAGMRRLGYNRNAKRCKEKWENINKYFKKVKESNKKRPGDSKTCPYFHQLDALYKQKNYKHDTTSASNQLFRPDQNSVPLMVRPEQQWPPQPEHQPHHHQQQQQQVEAMEDIESDQDIEEEDKDGDADADADEEDDGGSFEIVPNKQVNSISEI